MNHATPNSRRSFLSCSLLGGLAATATQLTLPQSTAIAQVAPSGTAPRPGATSAANGNCQQPYHWNGIMQGLFPPRSKRVNSYEILFDELSAMQYRLTHMHELTTHQRISRGCGPVLTLDPRPDNERIEGITVDVGRGKSMKVKDWLSATNTMGLLVLKGNTILTEQYCHGLQPDTRVTGYSLGKVLAALGVGAALQVGKIDLNAPVQTYIPELGATG